ncbi:MAG: ferrous iron transport protein B [Thermodesulfobacteriota bacterium]|nr:ferrous iron transport protein B [Thermodesulfobacteriota bacterium]
MRIALAGQPNCGKSTIFNHIAGYKAITSNFPGTTVKYTETKTHIEGYTCNCIDLPGTYSLTSGDPAELEARRHLLSGEIDVIINVIDASLLCRSLELTLQLLELEVPMVICLNMIDEAQRKGIQIDIQKLSKILGIPVISSIATTGKGLKELFNEVMRVWEEKKEGKNLKFSRDIEEIVDELISILNSEWPVEEKVPSRFLAIKLLENNQFFIHEINPLENIPTRVKLLQEKMEQIHGVPSDEVISSERHALAMNLFEQVSKVIHPPKKDIRILIDHWVMHKFIGYLILAAVFYGLFNFIFGIGKFVEEPMMGVFDQWIGWLEGFLGKGTLSLFLSKGVLQGIAGGIAIVLPYLVPFLIGLSFLEDIGYLPRVAFLMDVFMHRIGLHGKSIIPFILGYGCSVPAVMATRILEFPQHRFIVSILATMIPCAARITIIFALVAFLISPNAALAIFVLNIFVVGVSGKILSTFYPEPGSLGLILEIPAYQLPSVLNTLKKSWYRIREFVVIAWPILILGSALLALMEYFGVERYVNWFFSPLTHLLGLPVSVGTTLIFGLLRKELSMIMLTQALGTTQVLTVMTKTQVMVFTVFVTFYIPCLATIATLWREIGKKGAFLTIIFTLSVAIILALATRIFLGIFFW